VRALTTAGSDDGTAATSGDSSGGSSDASGSDTSGSSGTASLVGLQYGSNGAAVAYLQQALIDAGISVYGGADGVYGPATVSSVKAYQKAKGIEQSGRVDRATADALAGGSGATGVKKPAPNVMLGLRHGSLGSAVKKLQQAIIDAGVTLRGGADGIFGPATERALKSFQASQGLPANGVVDEATLSALGNPKAPVRTGGGSSTSGTAADGFAAYGEHGARVTALQSALVDAGVPLRGGVDGDFGPATSAAVMEFQQRRGLPVTGKIDAATASALGVEAAAKPKAPDASTLKLAAFPVQGYCQYYDTWLAPRGGGRQHVGVDILAKRGNEVYAVADGTITKLYEDYPGSLAGNGIRLTMSDGTYFFYAHFVSHAKGIRVGAEVTAGQVVGYVGSTGSSSAPHLHFEVHPRGGAAVNPYPIVKAVDDC
jgi:peptidoglycan hydrolase-like protein with peptidoglycan-binding domain